MKKLVVLLSLIGLSAGVVAQNEPASVSPPVVEYSPNELLEAWGFFLGQQYTLDLLDLTDDEIAAVSAGMSNYAKGETVSVDLESAAAQLEPYLTRRLEAVRDEALVVNKRKEFAYMDSLIGVPNVRSLATGLFFEILEPGSDNKPDSKSKVSVHYTGTLLDGRVFDSSYGRGSPTTFKLNEVIPAWTQGLPLIGVGGKIRLHAPAELAYGDEGNPGIPPASALVFEVELLDIIVEGEVPNAPTLTVE